MNLLLVASSFPPEQSGGIGRPYSLFKYLKNHGINVTVITTDSFGRIPGEKDIYRFESFVNWRESSIFSRKRIMKYLSACSSRLWNIISDSWWVNNAERGIEKIIADKKFDFIYVTFPLPEAFLIALTLKDRLQIPLIAEFRDGLCYESIIRDANFLHLRYMKRLEKQVVDVADQIITIGNELSKYFIKTYPYKVIKTVHNGYDPDDFKGLEDVRKELDTDLIRIGYFGRFGTSRAGVQPERVFSALKKIKESSNNKPARFRLDLIGDFSQSEIKLVHKFNIQDLVFFFPIMSKRDGLVLLKNKYDYLLFCGSEGEKTIVSSKLLEYINLDTPILGICKGNEAEEIIKLTKTGEVSDFDETSIETLFLNALGRKISFAPDEREILKFSRLEQSRMIADIIKSNGIMQTSVK